MPRWNFCTLPAIRGIAHLSLEMSHRGLPFQLPRHPECAQASHPKPTFPHRRLGCQAHETRRPEACYFKTHKVTEAQEEWWRAQVREAIALDWLPLLPGK